MLFWQNNFVLIATLSFDLNFILEHEIHFWNKSLKQMHSCSTNAKKLYLEIWIEKTNKNSERFFFFFNEPVFPHKENTKYVFFSASSPDLQYTLGSLRSLWYLYNTTNLSVTI